MPSAGLMDIVNAVAQLATAFFTGGLLYIAATQIRALRDENRKWETVKACTRYTVDPVLFECARKIRQASKGSDYSITNMRPLMHEIRAVVNYLDSLGVGVAQGVYDPKIIEDNLSLVIDLVVANFTTTDFADELNFDALSHLFDLRNSWRKKAEASFDARSR